MKKALLVQYFISMPDACKIMKKLSTKKNIAEGFFFELIDENHAAGRTLKYNNKKCFRSNYKFDTPLVHLKIWRDLIEGKHAERKKIRLNVKAGGVPDSSGT